MRFFFSAGEASGDLYAAELAKRLRDHLPSAVLEGVGGRKLRGAGANLAADSSDWGALGILEALQVVPKVTLGYQFAKHVLKSGAPGVFVPIDFGYMNVKLGRFAKRRGWKVVYFIPPGSWRKHKQGRDLPEFCDEIVTPFSWSAEILKSMGANVHYFGHPLLDLIPEHMTVARQGIALMPGSREHEIASNLPALLRTVEELSRDHATVALADSARQEDLVTIAKRLGTRVQLEFTRDRYPLLQTSELVLCCSGTATLEAALCRCPTVVVYRGTRAMEIEYRIRRPKFDFIALPNILLGRALLPELIQWEATPERIAAEARPLLLDSPQRRSQNAGFEEIRSLLNPPGALDRTVQLLSELVS